MDTLDDELNNSNIADFLEEALERVRAGEPVDAIINSYPENYQTELLSLLSFTDALEEVAHSSVPQPSASRQMAARANFLQAAGAEKEQQIVEQRNKEFEDLLTVDVQQQPNFAPALRGTDPRIPRSLVEAEVPGLIDRIASFFTIPSMRLAPIALAALLLLAGGAFEASRSIPGQWAYPVKQVARNVGLSLVPERVQNERKTAQNEARKDEIKQAQKEAAEQKKSREWQDEITLLDVEQGTDSTILHTTIGDFEVTEDAALEVLLAEIDAGNITEGTVIRAELQIVPENPNEVKAIVVEVVATPTPSAAVEYIPMQTPSTNEINVSNTPTPTIVTVEACVKSIPTNWLPYTVQSGDTLNILANRRQVDYLQLAQIAQNNCISDVNIIVMGDVIYLPPSASLAPTAPSTATNLPTVTPVLLVQTPTTIPTVMSTVVSPLLIDTPLPVLATPTDMGNTTTFTITTVPVTPIATVAPTVTSIPTATVTLTVTAVPTATAIPTATPVPTATAVSTVTVILTATVVPTELVPTTVPITNTEAIETVPVTATATATTTPELQPAAIPTFAASPTTTVDVTITVPISDTVNPITPPGDDSSAPATEDGAAETPTPETPTPEPTSEIGDTPPLTNTESITDTGSIIDTDTSVDTEEGDNSDTEAQTPENADDETPTESVPPVTVPITSTEIISTPENPVTEPLPTPQTVLTETATSEPTSVPPSATPIIATPIATSPTTEPALSPTETATEAATSDETTQTLTPTPEISSANLTVTPTSGSSSVNPAVTATAAITPTATSGLIYTPTFVPTIVPTITPSPTVAEPAVPTATTVVAPTDAVPTETPVMPTPTGVEPRTALPTLTVEVPTVVLPTAAPPTVAPPTVAPPTVAPPTVAPTPTLVGPISPVGP